MQMKDYDGFCILSCPGGGSRYALAPPAEGGVAPFPSKLWHTPTAAGLRQATLTLVAPHTYADSGGTPHLYRLDSSVSSTVCTENDRLWLIECHVSDPSLIVCVCRRLAAFLHRSPGHRRIVEQGAASAF